MQKLKERISRHIDLIEFSRGSGKDDGAGPGWYILKITGLIRAGPFGTKEEANEAYKRGREMGVVKITDTVEYRSK